MKITQEILDNGKWLSEEIFRWKHPKYGNMNLKKMVCKWCGEGCFSAVRANKKEVFCDQECVHSARIGQSPSNETRQRMSKSRIGKPSPNKGKKASEETRKKQSIARKGKPSPIKGRPKSEEHKKAISKTLTGIKQSEETKRKRAESNTCPYASKGIPKYDLYAPQLMPYEECKRSKKDPNILRVKCTYCGKWFVPSRNQIDNRIRGINHNDNGRFYCSEGCKKECPIYNQTKYYKGHIGINSREVQPELRQLVFLRDNYECQKCGSKKFLHCHHFEGVEQNPIESADVDNCITLCRDCHEESHKDYGCRKIDLRKCSEENNIRMAM